MISDIAELNADDIVKIRELVSLLKAAHKLEKMQDEVR
jgi:hypothetical protein